jgi:hypothetical protein
LVLCVDMCGGEGHMLRVGADSSPYNDDACLFCHDADVTDYGVI